MVSSSAWAWSRLHGAAWGSLLVPDGMSWHSQGSRLGSQSHRNGKKTLFCFSMPLPAQGSGGVACVGLGCTGRGAEQGTWLLQIITLAPQWLLTERESCRLPSVQPVLVTDLKKATEGRI